MSVRELDFEESYTQFVGTFPSMGVHDNAVQSTPKLSSGDHSLVHTGSWEWKWSEGALRLNPRLRSAKRDNHMGGYWFPDRPFPLERYAGISNRPPRIGPII